VKKSVLLFLFIFSSTLFCQLYQGPEAGSVSSGAVISTNSFSSGNAPVTIEPAPVRNKIPYRFKQDVNDLNKSAGLQSLIQVDASVSGLKSANVDSSVLLNKFEGIPETNSIPPDPYLAVGPNHIVAVVNSSFRIYDKNGQIIKTIVADNWFSNVLSPLGCFDPKVVYDRYDNRWVMVWLDQNDDTKRSNILISVSDDSDPTGTWYNWALKGNLNGTTSTNNWSDYQGVGFDKQAFYITSNQFAFGGGYQYSKIRIIDKELLYSNSPSSLEWLDIWNIKHIYPNGENVFGIRPVRMYGDAPEYYFVARSPYETGNFLTIFTLKDPLSSPVLTSTRVNVAPYYYSDKANEADQYGDQDTLKLDGGGFNLRAEPIYREGYIYTVFGVASGPERQYLSLRYFSLDAAAGTLFRDITIGADGYWYLYPAIEVDKDHNVLLTYSRTGHNEFAGAFFMDKSVDSDEFNGSRILERGRASYVKDYDSKRNRWGDYMGIWLDPEDEKNVWVFTEYAAGRNTWGTKLGKVLLRPYEKAFMHKSQSAINMTHGQINQPNDTATIVIKNFGLEDLQITNIFNTKGDFSFVSLPSFPHTIKTYDSLAVKVYFIPTQVGKVSDVITIQSNSTNKPEDQISIEGLGYSIKAAEKGVIYASTALSGGGNILTIDPATGTGTAVGKSGYSGITSLTINPKSQYLYGLYSSSGTTQIVQANAEKGDAYEQITLPFELNAAAYDNEGFLYAVSKSNRLYKINDRTGDSTIVGNLSIPVAAITFNPADGQLWASVGTSSAVKDKIYKINKANGDTTYAGKTGLGKVLNALTFDNSGNLYGTFGTSLQISTLVKIDPVTAAASTIGPIGFKGVTGLAVSNMTTDIENDDVQTLPTEFALKQNYPNPFNPNTIIEYSLPFDSNIKVSVFNLIGEEVKVLQSGSSKAGYHKINWDATDNNGKKLSSGIYLYRIIATAQGKEYRDSKKMILLK